MSWSFLAILAALEHEKQADFWQQSLHPLTYMG